MSHPKSLQSQGPTCISTRVRMKLGTESGEFLASMPHGKHFLIRLTIFWEARLAHRVHPPLHPPNTFLSFVYLLRLSLNPNTTDVFYSSMIISPTLFDLAYPPWPTEEPHALPSIASAFCKPLILLDIVIHPRTDFRHMNSTFLFHFFDPASSYGTIINYPSIIYQWVPPTTVSRSSFDRFDVIVTEEAEISLLKPADGRQFICLSTCLARSHLKMSSSG